MLVSVVATEGSPMRITNFHSADYVIGLEHDGRQFTITVPFDAFQYVEIMAQVYREQGVTLPYLCSLNLARCFSILSRAPLPTVRTSARSAAPTGS